MEFIKNNSFGGAEDELGNRTITRARLESTLKKFGMDKLRAMFEPEEVKFLGDIVKITKIMEPVPGTALGRGPSAQAVNNLMDSVKRRIERIPILNAFIDIDFDPTKGALMAKPTQKFIPQPIATQALPFAGVAATQIERDQ